MSVPQDLSTVADALATEEVISKVCCVLHRAWSSGCVILFVPTRIPTTFVTTYLGSRTYASTHVVSYGAR